MNYKKNNNALEEASVVSALSRYEQQNDHCPPETPLRDQGFNALSLPRGIGGSYTYTNNSSNNPYGIHPTSFYSSPSS